MLVLKIENTGKSSSWCIHATPFREKTCKALFFPGVPICLVLPASTAQASKGHFKFLDYHGGFPLNSMMSLFMPLRGFILNCH